MEVQLFLLGAALPTLSGAVLALFATLVTFVLLWGFAGGGLSSVGQPSTNQERLAD